VVSVLFIVWCWAFDMFDGRGISYGRFFISE
jgi:hypothetical protein